MKILSISLLLPLSLMSFVGSAQSQQTTNSAAIVFTVAGGTFENGQLATTVGLGAVSSTAIDTAGNLYIADSDNFLIRKMDTKGVLTTVAGNGTPATPQYIGLGFFPGDTFTVTSGGNGDGGPATSAELGFPTQIALDNAGNLYILEDRTRIRKVNISGIITTIAGTGIQGVSGDGGPGASANISIWTPFVVDGSGNIYFVNQCILGNYPACVSVSQSDVRIRKVNTQGLINTVAGNGTPGHSGDGGPATTAEIYPAYSPAVDSLGDLYFADGSDIRRVDSSGTITTVAGNGTVGFSGDGGPATNAEISASSVLLDGNNNLYFVQCCSTQGLPNRIRKVSTNGIITTVAGNGTTGSTGDGGPATNAEIQPDDLFVDPGGNCFFYNYTFVVIPPNSSQSFNSEIRKVDTTGIITTVAGNGTPGFSGDGGPAVQAQINGGFLYYAPAFLFDNNHDLIFVDQYLEGDENSRIREVNSSGVINTVAGNGTEGYAGDGGPATSKEVDGPAGLAIDSNGNLYIADFNNQRIEKVDPSGVLTAVAGNGIEDPGNSGSSKATTDAIYEPFAVVVDQNGSLYFTTGNSNSVLKVDASGNVSTFAGGVQPGGNQCTALGDGGSATNACLSQPLGLAFDGNGNLYIGDTGDVRVRKVNSAGIITTVAGNGTQGYSGDGGLATSAEIGQPSGIAVDSAGNLFIADTDNFRVRKVDAAGNITTVAGNGTQGFSGDGGPAMSAELNFIAGLAVDKTGNLYIADSHDNRIRAVDIHGVITTFAGTGTSGFSGDGGPAISATFSFPGGLAVDNSGALYVGDVFNYRVREIAAAFTVSSASPSITIPTPGGQSTLALNVVPAARFTGSVNLTCAVAFSGTGTASYPPTCSLGPAMISITGPGTSASTLSIATTAATSASMHSQTRGGSFVALIGRASAGMLCILFFPFLKRRRSAWFSVAILVFAGIGMIALGCGGGGGGGGGTTNPGTTAGNYNVTITASSGSYTSTLIVPLAVQ
jgi:sugar lactone lactonase YvrE